MAITSQERRAKGQAEAEHSQRRAALGALINIAGRQRMLSHRAVMFLALSQLPDAAAPDRHLDQAEAALDGYAAGVRLLIEGDEQLALPPLFSARVRAILAEPIDGYASGRQAVEAFGLRGGACLDRLRAGHKLCGGEIRQLADLCGATLLPLLNRTVGAFESDLVETLEAEAARTADIRAVMTGALEDIEQTATRIRLIAFNALIEAARAGDAGRAFSAIAEEIKNLGAQTRQDSARVQAAMERLFAA